MRIKRNYTISEETDKKLRKISEETGLKMSTIIDKAIEKYEKELVQK